MQLPRNASADTSEWQGLNRSERMTSAHWASYSFSSSAGQLGWMSGRVSGWQLQRTIFGLMVWSGCRMVKLSLSDFADVWTHGSSHFLTDTQSASVISHCWYSAIYCKNSMSSLVMESNDSALQLFIYNVPQSHVSGSTRVWVVLISVHLLFTWYIVQAFGAVSAFRGKLVVPK